MPWTSSATATKPCGAARVAAGLNRLVADFALNGLTYYYRGLDGNEFERLGAGLILGNSLLTGSGPAAPTPSSMPWTSARGSC